MKSSNMVFILLILLMGIMLLLAGCTSNNPASPGTNPVAKSCSVSGGIVVGSDGTNYPSVCGSDGNIQTFSCDSATGQVVSSSKPCPAGQACSNANCVVPSCTNGLKICEQGTVCNNGECIQPNCANGLLECLEGDICVNGACVAPSCKKQGTVTTVTDSNGAHNYTDYCQVIPGGMAGYNPFVYSCANLEGQVTYCGNLHHCESGKCVNDACMERGNMIIVTDIYVDNPQGRNIYPECSSDNSSIKSPNCHVGSQIYDWITEKCPNGQHCVITDEGADCIN